MAQVTDRRFERFDETEGKGDLRTGLVAVMRYRYRNLVRRERAKVGLHGDLRSRSWHALRIIGAGKLRIPSVTGANAEAVARAGS